jgi:NADPH:quinone reductase-like Zn-dependent oxidoreductase
VTSVYTIETARGRVQRGTREVGDPGPGQVLVDVKAVSLNFRDLILVRGRPGMPPLSNVIACSDGAGVVRAVGPGVRAFQPGDRVCGTFFENWSSGTLTPEAWAAARGGGIDGVLAERVLLNEGGAVRAPSHLSFEQAACLPCAAVTAWHALIERANVRPGQSVLLLGTGGVSTFGLQIARAAGARVIVTSSSDEKLERARRLGAHDGVNYRMHPQWSKRVLELTDGRGVDVTLEVGGPETFVQSLVATRMAGTIAVIGALETGQGTIHPSQIYAKSLRLHGIYVGSREMFTSLNAFLELHRLEPSIDRVFGFDDAPAAYQYLASAAHFGKVVIRVG